MKGFRFLAAFIAAISAVSGNPQDLVSGKVSIKDGMARINLGFSPRKGVSVHSSLAIAAPGFMPGSLGLQYESEALKVFCGPGELKNGLSLRTKPYARVFPEAGTPWSQAGVLSGNSLLFGFKTGNFTFVAKGEEEKPGKQSGGGPGPTVDVDPASSFRFSGFEWAGRSDAARASFSGYIAGLPEASFGGSWRPYADPDTGGTIFGLAAASWARGGALGFGIWLAASAGYREEPGWACSAEMGFPENLENSGRPQTDSPFAAGLYAYAASPEYRSAMGEVPLYDFLADMSATFRFRALAVSARVASYSLSSAKGAGEATRLLRDEAKPLERLLWVWRKDLLRAGLDIVFSRCALTARASLDGAGVERCSVALRNEMPFDRPFRAVLIASADLAFSADGAEEADGGEENEEDDFEGKFSAPRLIGRPARRELGFSSFKGGLSLSWESRGKVTSLGKGEVSLSVSAKEKDNSHVFSASAGISRAFNIGGLTSVSVAVKTPEKGYVLWETPRVLPSLIFGIRVGRTKVAR